MPKPTKPSAKSKPAAKSPKPGPAKPAPAKPAPKGKPSPAKAAPAKPTGAKPAPAKPAPPKSAPPKPAPAKANAPSKVSPKPEAKPSLDKAAKPGAKAPPGKPVAKPVPGKGAPVAPAAPAKSPAGKAPAKPAVPGKVDSKPAPATPPAATGTTAGAGAPAGAAAANGKKGITIVAAKPVKKAKVKTLEMPVEPLIKPGMKWKPLIASGPKAPPSTGIPGVSAPTEFKPDPKAKLSKKELDQYKKILLDKRSELIGDINNMEEEALRQNSGSLSTLPQHMAEQGSDTFDQSLSLDLAQVDRHLLKEIEAALVRIELGTYGVCERTGKRISAERLAELPWARYSIEAAREMERRPTVERSEASSDDDSL